jgi:hypothetical protein
MLTADQRRSIFISIGAAAVVITTIGAVIYWRGVVADVSAATDRVEARLSDHFGAFIAEDLSAGAISSADAKETLDAELKDAISKEPVLLEHPDAMLKSFCQIGRASC